MAGNGGANYPYVSMRGWLAERTPGQYLHLRPHVDMNNSDNGRQDAPICSCFRACLRGREFQYYVLGRLKIASAGSGL